MCGITGIIHPKHREFIQPMTQIIAHRGPDGEGFFSDESISLGHRRLAIQDLSANGRQPMFTEDGRYCIILNGEIYNHFDIRAKLKDKYTFRSTSDTETVLYGYVEYGLDIFNMLNGIFALAIYDTHTHDLIVARDPFGVKPLYYYHENNKFIFVSEIKSLLAIPDLNLNIDPKAMLQYIEFLWSPGESTMYNEVKKLLPGHYIQMNTSMPETLSMVRYYTIPFEGKYDSMTEKEWIDALDDHLTNAVKRQLLSDVLVGFFLSGGLDSSAIVALARKIMPDKTLQCYTIDSGSDDMGKEGFSDDLYYARKVADHLNVNLTVVKSKIDIIDEFDQMIYHLDEPQADLAPLHVLNICRQARKDGYVVLLGGTAGDDLFSGYRRHQTVRLEQFLKFIPKFIFKGSNTILNLFHSKNPYIRRLKKLTSDMDKPWEERLTGYFSWINTTEAKKLFSTDLQNQISTFLPSSILKSTLSDIPKEVSKLNQMLYLELNHFLPDHNLNYTDKMSMACGVEVRVPFLDKELVEFSTRIPPAYKMKGITTKYLLKKVMERYLPHDVIYRPKAGFAAPVRVWIKEELGDHISQVFTQEQIENDGVFDYNAVQNLIKDNQSNKIDASYTILGLLAIRSWFHQFITQK
ncbi:MAG: asparagine synthase (glutamine-hydrolyzing) [Chitinophagales bacterium]|nr:asparagine synthase (glutamine-hydrolyzing) [Chitinophagales bacterium]